MTKSQFQKIKHLNYRDFCAWAIKQNGQPKVAYGKPGYSKPGYECHHIDEDIESALSDKNKVNDPTLTQYQQPDRLVYLTPEEHLWAHLLISKEVLLKDSTSERCEDLSKGGISLLLNCEMAKMDEKLVAQMIASYCNSISAQMILDADSSIEAYEQFRKIYNTKLSLNILIEKYLEDNICLAHNREAYVETEAFLMHNPSAIACICTCGGKTPFGLEYMLTHQVPGKKFLVVLPNTNINLDWEERKDKDGVLYSTYLYDTTVINSLAMYNNYLDKTKYNWDNYCGIIIDEVHHIHEGATVWTKPIKYAMSLGLKVLGLTATIKDSQTKEEDTIFGGRIIYGLDIVNGIKDKVLWAYNYISSIYSADGLPEQYNLLNEKLDLFLNTHKVADTIIKYEKQLNRAGQKKGIIFVAGTRNIPDAEKANKLAQFDRAIELVKAAYPNAKFYKLSSHQTKEVNRQNKEDFRNNTTDDCFLVSFGMVNEGAHYDGVNTLVMFRTTHTESVFDQQLGRIMRLRSKCPVDPKLTVFDFTNNAITLLDEADKEQIENYSTNKRNRTPRPEEYLAGLDVITACEATDILEYLTALRAAKDQGKENRMFSKVLDNIGFTVDNVDTAFEYEVIDLWKDIEVTTKGTTEIKAGPKVEKSAEEAIVNMLGETATVQVDNTKQPEAKKAKANGTKTTLSKQELFVYLMKLTFDRATLNEVFTLTDRLNIADQQMLKELCKVAGLKVDSFNKLLTADKLVKYWEMRFELINQTLCLQ